VSKLPNTN